MKLTYKVVKDGETYEIPEDQTLMGTSVTDLGLGLVLSDTVITDQASAPSVPDGTELTPVVPAATDATPVAPDATDAPASN